MLRDVLFIAWQDLRVLLRDKETLLWVFLMPPIFIGFFGMTTAGFSPPELSLDAQVPLEIEGLEPDDPLAADLRAALEAGGYALDVEGAWRRLVVPDELGARLLNGDEPLELELHHPGGSSLELDRYRVGRALGSVLARIVVLEDRREPISADALAALRSEPPVLSLDVRAAGSTRRIPSGFEQTVPANLVMFTLIVLLTSGGVMLVQERRQGLLVRLAAAPLGRGRVVAGKWLGKLLLAAVQIGFLLAVGRWGFGVRLGPSPFAVLGVLLAWASFCASLSLALGVFARSEGQAVGLGVAGAMVLSALGGCWWPLEIAPDAMQRVGLALPTGWAMDALHRLMSFGQEPSAVWPHLAAISVSALLLGALVARRFRFTPDV